MNRSLVRYKGGWGEEKEKATSGQFNKEEAEESCGFKWK